MFLFHLRPFLIQLLPPPWRLSARADLLFALCKPIQGVYESFWRYRRDTQMNATITPQVATLEWGLRHALGPHYEHVYIADGIHTGQYNAYLPINTPSKKRQMAEEFLNKHRRIGTHFQIFYFN